MFNETVRQLFGTDDLQRAWEDIISLSGEFVAIHEIQNFVNDDGYYISSVIMRHENRGFGWNIAFCEDGLIAGLRTRGMMPLPITFMNLWMPAFIIYCFALALSVERIMGVFFGKRRTSLLVMLGAYLLFYVSSYFSFVLLSVPITVIASLSHFIIALTYKSSMKKRILAAVCCYLYVAIIETIIILGVTTILQGAFAGGFIINNFDPVYLIAGLPIFIIASMLRRFKNIRKSAMSSPVFWIPSILIPVFSIIIIVALLVLFPSIYHLPQFILIIIVMLFAINLLAFYLQDVLSLAYEDKLKATLHIQEKEYYFSQCQLMQESVEQVKSMRHDMKIHLAALKDFTAGNKEATDYLNRLLGDIGNSEVYSDTGNIAFDSIINFKLKNILEDGIKLDIKIFIPPALNIEVADIVTILGNLLDNALDAVAKVEDKMIKLDVSYDKGGLLINLDNTFDGKIKYTQEKDGKERHIATRKDDDGHGHGLKNIRKSVEKYNGHMDITHEGNMFSVGILLYVNDV